MQRVETQESEKPLVWKDVLAFFIAFLRLNLPLILFLAALLIVLLWLFG